MDNAGIAAEAMSREDYLRDIIAENRRNAQGLGSCASNLKSSNIRGPIIFFTEEVTITPLWDLEKDPHFSECHKNP